MASSKSSGTGPEVPLEIRLTPHGHVAAWTGKTGEAPRWAQAVAGRFSEDGEAAGLVALATAKVPAAEAGPAVLFWRGFAADFLRSLCHVPESVPLGPDIVDPPTPAALAERTLEAPPMPGAEYLSPEVLLALWRRLLDWAVAEAEHSGGLAAFLESRAPQWARVGRVTLHLAENKGDEEYPFAFLATYATGLAPNGRVRRLPLGRALKEYADARRKNELRRLLSPIRAAAKRSELIADLVETGDIFHPLAWTPAEAHAFLQQIPLYEKCGLLAQVPNWWKKRPRPQVAVKLDTRKNSPLGLDALLDFKINVALGGESLAPEEIEALLAGTDGLVLLRGQWVEVDREKLREALAHWKEVEREASANGVSFIEGMRLLAGASLDLRGTAVPEGHASWAFVDAGEHLRDTLHGLRRPGELAGPPPKSLRGTLRHYQQAGLDWLWLCARLGLGACLADDMGLGKTIQVLAALLRHKEHARKQKTSAIPSLLVVPASLVANWKAEAARFAPTLKLFIAHPSETPKQSLATIAEAADPARRLRGVDLVVTTYGMAARLPWLAEIQWQWVVLDEAQAIKNPSARQTKAVKKLRGTARVALTGTPVENRLGDLWSIFDFLNPGLLGSAARFKVFARQLEKQRHARYAPLRKLVAPYILRRMKTDPDIVPDLPEKTEMQTYCGLAKRQAILYRREVAALRKAMKETAGIKRKGLVLSTLMRFKQICNHPSQFTGDADFHPADSGKFARLAEICSEIASRGEKTLVFTQFREMTEPLADFLAEVFARPGLVLHGATPVRQRKQLVAAFQDDDGPPFFVLSIKAGGTGLNLTAASHVVHFDRWWNPAVENQATDRAFRIGQHRNVVVHKFVTRGTVEEKIDALVREKQNLANALLSAAPEKTLTEMNDDELLSLVSLDIERASL